MLASINFYLSFQDHSANTEKRLKSELQDFLIWQIYTQYIAIFEEVHSTTLLLWALRDHLKNIIRLDLCEYQGIAWRNWFAWTMHDAEVHGTCSFAVFQFFSFNEQIKN